jgi:DNA-binding GntR family transcriptional regulator
MSAIDAPRGVWHPERVNRSRNSGAAASLADRAYYSIRDLILRGKHPMGSAISRTRLCEELGMSMLPVSEAVQRLESEGLLESRPQVGTRVRVPTEQDVRDLFVIREMLESQAARMFVERATFAQRFELKQMSEQMDTLFDRLQNATGDPEFVYAVHSYHSQLHMRIAEYSGCASLRDMVQKNNVLVLNWLYDVVGLQALPPPGFHHQLAEILAGDDPYAADKAMRAHVRFAVEETVRAIGELAPSLEKKWRLGRARAVSR